MRSGFNQGIAELPYFTADDSLHINEFVHQAVIEVGDSAWEIWFWKPSTRSEELLFTKSSAVMGKISIAYVA